MGIFFRNNIFPLKMLTQIPEIMQTENYTSITMVP